SPWLLLSCQSHTREFPAHSGAAGELLPPTPTVRHPSFSSPFPSPVDPAPSVCCFAFTRRPIPLSLLKSFEYANGRCPKPAVIFHTKRGIQVCADPSEQWVQDRIRDLSSP
ncbi:C-C motif chemokine 4-like, partial [Thamnophis elegans]|uniref:C-C motif chemokine 4-like n=1 Tax=Thamnophis elegans TaxID=35005 RepID=UPI001377F01F